MLTFIFLLISSIVGGLIAKSKNRNLYLWGAFSFLMPFLIFVLLFLPDGASKAEQIEAIVLKDTFIEQYQSNQPLYQTNTFLEVVFIALTEGRTVALDDLQHAIDVLQQIEQTNKDEKNCVSIT